MRAIANALRIIVMGLVLSTFIGMNVAPAAMTSPSMRPPLDTTIGRCPPACRLGVTTSAVSGLTGVATGVDD